MGYINITNIKFEGNNEKITQDFVLEINLESLKEINKEISWKCIFISDPDQDSNDQVLDEIVMNSLSYGKNNFEWAISPPDYSKLVNPFDIFDTSLLMIVVYIENQAFFRCSYLFSHEYDSEELKDSPPEKIEWDHIIRKIKTDNPIISICDINWDSLFNTEGNTLLIDNIEDHRFQNFDILSGNQL